MNKYVNVVFHSSEEAGAVVCNCSSCCFYNYCRSVNSVWGGLLYSKSN